jgi:hypothetical protein
MPYVILQSKKGKGPWKPSTLQALLLENDIDNLECNSARDEQYKLINPITMRTRIIHGQDCKRSR